MEQVRDRVAGLDVHRDTVVACARVGGGRQGRKITVDKARFATTTAGVAQLAGWLADHEVTSVAMESTGVYWKPVYYGLEDLFEEVWLVNALHVKRVPGRKTDMGDAEWLADVVAHGMVRPSFVPPREIRELRELTRYRKTQVNMRTQEVQRLEKLLQDAGIKVSSVASKVLGASTRAMVEAMIAGETDPAVLAQMAKGRLRDKIPALTEALAGRFRSHHGAVARQILDHIDFLDSSIAALDEEVRQRMGPFEGALAVLQTMVGIGRTTAEVIVAETGADMARFPTPGQLAAWSGLAPANRESAGKRRAAGHRQGARWLRAAMVEAARSAVRSKDTYLAAQYRQITARRGPNKAAVAVAHTMIVAIWHMLSTGQPSQDLGPDHLARRNTQAETRRLIHRLEALGHHVELTPAA